ncbi:MAG: PilN domain-containing protein [Vicinamibacterales bacterium]
MIRINLIAAEQKPAKAKLPVDLGRYVVAVGVLLLAATGAGIGWWYWTLTQQAEQVETQITAAQSEVARLKSVLQQVDQFEQRREQLRQRVALIEELRADQSGPVHLLDELSRHLPERLWLTDLKQTGADITFDGVTTSLTSLADFVANLEGSAYFKKPVEILDSQVDAQKDGTDLVKFKVKAQFGVPSAAPAGATVVATTSTPAPAKRQGD